MKMILDHLKIVSSKYKELVKYIQAGNPDASCMTEIDPECPFQTIYLEHNSFLSTLSPNTSQPWNRKKQQAGLIATKPGPHELDMNAKDDEL